MCYFPFSRTIRYIKCSFNLPDIIDRFIQGKNTGLYHEPGLPNITGNMRFDYGTLGSSGPYINGVNGSLIGSETVNGRPMSYDNNPAYGLIRFDASNSSPIYGNSNTVQPKSIELSFYIKF